MSAGEMEMREGASGAPSAGRNGATVESRIEEAGSRRRAFEALATEARRRREAISWARIVVFLLIVGCVAVGMRSEEEGVAAFAGALLLVVLFDLLVRKQRRQEELERKNAELARINERSAARCERDWERLPAADAPVGLEGSPLARDLNVFGRGSLFQLLGTARTADARALLARWLLSPAPPAEISDRHAAVRERAHRLDLRQELEWLASQPEPDPRVMAGLRTWAASTQDPPGSGWRIALARGLPALLLALGAAHAAGVLPPLWIGVIPVLGLVWIVSAGWASEALGPVEMRASGLARRGEMIRLLLDARFESPRLLRLQGALRGGGTPADVWIGRLTRIVRLAEIRYSPIVYLPLQLATLWDSHLVALLLGWRRRAGAELGGWLDAIAEIEALAALGALAYENPEWTLPEVDPTTERWTARALGHPLLPPRRRVCNDVELGPSGTFVLVTGSNMSGKSTLLRAIGANVLLAQAGAPVCARALHIPPTRLGTSFVIEDSLEDGISFYLAELRRLKSILDDAAGHARSGVRYLFLLDEILRGTNSGERQIAVRRILLELLGHGAAGFVSTHDLALADVEALASRSMRVHFRERFDEGPEGPRMSFDYELREGLATTSNALALLALVGIRGGEAGEG